METGRDEVRVLEEGRGDDCFLEMGMGCDSRLSEMREKGFHERKEYDYH